jgi:hypothetical protein
MPALGLAPLGEPVAADRSLARIGADRETSFGCGQSFAGTGGIATRRGEGESGQRLRRAFRADQEVEEGSGVGGRQRFQEIREERFAQVRHRGGSEGTGLVPAGSSAPASRWSRLTARALRRRTSTSRRGTERPSS